jgi:lysophospholipase L1-like esterase
VNYLTVGIMQAVYSWNMKKLLRYAFSSLLLVFGLVAIQPAAASALPANSYVALGDSIASGAGLPPNTTDPNAIACQRSDKSYPFVVASSLGTSVNHLACGGAKITEGLLRPQNVGGNLIDPQLDKAFANGTPKLISITAGTNDLGWSVYLNKCYRGDCGTFADTASSTYSIWRIHQNMRTVLDGIKARSGNTQPIVVVTGYFLPVSNNQPVCADTAGLTAKEIDWIRQQAKILNIALNAMAYEYDFVKFAPVDFSSHELCSAEPWIQGMTGPAFYHPTEKGQNAIAEAILRAR